MNSKNIFIFDNKNGCRLQFMAVANAIRYVHDNNINNNKIKDVSLESISWSTIEEYIVENDLEYDYSEVYDKLSLTKGISSINIPLFDKNGDIYVNIYFEPLTGYLHIY